MYYKLLSCYNKLFWIGGRSQVINDSYFVFKNKVVKYPFKVI